MSEAVKRHDLLERIRPLVEQLDREGLDILSEWVQDLKVARVQQSAAGELPAPGGTVDAREEFRDLLRRWDRKG
ncbi:MAG: hypothetical protein HY321_12275 [Armatimonadetes bacterium]|nr:hypothetical protein [Armatimonadota bacterium]